MNAKLRIFAVALLGVQSLTSVADVNVSAVTGTSCTVSWDCIEGANSYSVMIDRAVEPYVNDFGMAVDYGGDEACRQALESMGISSSRVSSFCYLDYGVYGVCLGDDWESGYVKLPAVPRTGKYRLSVTAFAHSSDLYSTLYIYEAYPDGTLLESKKFYNGDQYYEPEQLVCELSLEKGTRLVLLAGIENLDGEWGVNGRIILQDISIEELLPPVRPSFVEKFDEQTFTCQVEGLWPGAMYNCVVTAITDDSRITDVVKLTTLPCIEIFPLPDSEIAYGDMDETCRMRVKFVRPVVACDVDKISISPSNWTLADGETQALVRLLSSDDERSIAFQVNSWNTCLESNTHYTISFAPGAVVFADGKESPSFSYRLTTGGYPTALHPTKDNDASICRYGNTFVAANGDVLSVYDMMGHRVMSGFRLDISSLPRGVYIVRSTTMSMKLLR